jgi:hypothetical protein
MSEAASVGGLFHFKTPRVMSLIGTKQTSVASLLRPSPTKERFVQNPLCALCDNFAQRCLKVYELHREGLFNLEPNVANDGWEEDPCLTVTDYYRAVLPVQ